MSKVFDWKRFWCPRGTSIDLSDGGFLFDPDSEYGKYLNPNLVPFDKLAGKSSLALLGEPGIGKSWALRNQRENLNKTISEQGGKTLWLDLRSFGSEDRLWKALFESEEIKHWRNNSYTLHLFLDSLDECLLRIDNVAALIADQLPDEPHNRLRLRVACRTAPWPSILENALKHVFGDEGFEAYELAPLRRKDVLHAAEASRIIEPLAFLSRIESIDVTSFAIKPVTLRFLLNTYLQDGELPTNQIELYEKGCRILCEESNESRLSAGKHGLLSPSQRLTVASRIAAVTQFANRYAVWTEGEAGPIQQEDALIADLVGGTEPGLQDAPLSLDAIRETLDTGLFSSRGAWRIGWAHQTYAEFLTARYITAHRVPPQQVRSLIFHPEASRQRLVPQLHEVAAWISLMDEEVLSMVANSDPEALLGAASAGLSANKRKLVVDSILGQSESGRPFHLRWGLFSLFGRLEHPGLDVQLGPYITDRAKILPARRVAMNIARSCSVDKLASDLANIALDKSEDIGLRISAAVTVAHIAPSEVRIRLRPLALEEAGEDPDDELKGSGLIALWPNLITAKEVFQHSKTPKNQNLHGTYASFLNGVFLQKLNMSDLPVALEWFSKQPHRQALPGVIDRLMDGILKMAWENLEQPGVTESFAKAVLSRIRLHDDLLSNFRNGDLQQEMLENHERRRRLLEELLPQLRDQGRSAFLGNPLLAPHDFDWIIQRILTGKAVNSAPFEAKLLWYLIDTRNPEQMQTLFFACQADAVLNAECKGYFEAIPLDSEQARVLRENLRLERERTKPKLLVPSPSERIEQDLQTIENGQVDKWVYLTRNLSLEPTSTRYSQELNPDLTALPGWKAADGNTRKRIVAAAVRYVQDADPQNEEWFATSSIPYKAIEGFRALALLLVDSTERLQTITADEWRKWVPTLLRFLGTSDERQLQHQLLRRAYSLIPDVVLQRLVQLVDIQNQNDGYLFIKEIEPCWDQQMAQTILAKVTDPKLKPGPLRNLLQLLLQHNVPGARELSESLVSNPVPATEPDHSRALAAIDVLVNNTSDAGWPKVWPAIRDNVKSGRLIIETISYADPAHGGFIKKLAENELAELYVWMVENFPYSQHDHNRAGAMSSVDTAVLLRDAILEHLKKRSTFEACGAIQQIISEFPQYPWLRYHLEEAETLARAATWEPPSPKQLLSLFSNSRRHLVATEQELIAVVIESLDRLQVKLHQELPAIKDLWNVDHDEYWPKDENDLSDYVARHLKEGIQGRGIVVNREVQIRRGIGDGTGQFTDIHVDAVVPREEPNSYSSVSIIIETKGNWNTKLFESMQTQLRERYLKDLPFRTGIYLIGWFSCNKWDEVDYRKGQCPNVSLEAARKEFAQQANELSTDGYQIKSYILDCSLT